MQDLGLLLLRLTMGGLVAGHGAQKLFGMFEGHGLEGTGQFFENLGFHPGRRWAALAGMGEFGGGVMTALGFLHPVGPITTLGPMIVAWGRVHWGKPIWNTNGGGELPATYMSIALALAMMGPGKFSLDRMFGIRPHPALAMLVGACVAGGAIMALNQPTPEPTQPQQSTESTPQPESAESQQPNPAAAT
jgi:putative oxidoreductase